MDKIREFQKYKKRGAYHWDQIGKNIFKRNTFVLGRYNNMLTLVKSRVPYLKDKKILDVGCGDGVLSYLFAKDGATVSGIDYSSLAIAFAKEKTEDFDINFQQASAYELPFEESSFDVVISSDVIEHLEEVSKYLLEIKRVIKDEGIVVISTPIRFTEYPLDKEHVVEWFPDEFKEVILSEFQDVSFYYSHSLVGHEFIQKTLFGKSWYKVFFNLVSFFYNPFDGFNVGFKHKVLQYAVIKVKK